MEEKGIRESEKRERENEVGDGREIPCAVLRVHERKHHICASGSVVEYRLAKARVAGSNPVSRLCKVL